MKKLALLAISVLVLTPAAAEARPGALDRSFGHGGKVIAPQLPSEGQRSTSTAIAKLKDGETVVLAGNTLFAFKRDGKLARSFGGGIVQVTAPSSGSLALVDVASDREGRIIVGGTISSPLDSSQWAVYADESVFLARYEPDGSLDPSFGESGTLLTDLGASAPPVTTFPGQPTAAPPLSGLAGVAIDPAGRIVLSGLRVSRIAPCRGFVSIRDWQSYVARLRDDGELDPSFGGGGVVALPPSAGAGWAPPLLTRSGGVYLWVQGGGCSVAPSQLTRFGSNGQRVAAFGEGGSLLVPNVAVTDLAIDREGRIVILSSGGESAKLELEAPFANVLRVLPNGKMDTSFGKRGEVTLTAPRPYSVVSSAVAVDRFGRIVLAGTARSAKDGGGPRSFFVGRLTARGDVDPRFGKVGYARVRFGRRSESQASSLALVPGGSILVGGTFTRPSTPDGEGLALARLTSR